MLIFILNCLISFVFLEEDAFIAFRYVHNLGEGFGFVFNPGGENVEGFSNFLWTGILYFMYVIGLEVITAARIIGIILGLGTIYLSFVVTSRITDRHGALNLLPPAMIAFSPPLLYWYQTGLEPALFSFLLLGALYLHLEESKRIIPFPFSGVFCFLLALTRPEGILFFVVFAILKIPKAMRDTHGLNSFISWFFSCFLPFLAFIAIRYTIFQSIVPNTFYAKVNYSLGDAFHIGSLYTLGFLSDTRAWLWLIPFLAALLRARGEEWWRNLLPLILFISYMAFVLYVGGDFHIYFRFYAPLLPLLFITCTIGFWALHAHISERASVRATNIVLWILVLIILFVSTVYHRSPAWRDLELIEPANRSMISYRYQTLARDPSMIDTFLQNWVDPPGDILDKAAEWLEEEYPEDTRLATEQCGKVPFYTEFETYDMLGLNNKQVARIIHYGLGFDKYRDAFFEANADIVLLYYADGRFVDRLHIGKLVESKEFQGSYRLAKVLDFDYIYKLDEEYHRERYLLLFERRQNAVGISSPQNIQDMLDNFLPETPDEPGDRVEYFVVEL